MTDPQNALLVQAAGLEPPTTIDLREGVARSPRFFLSLVCAFTALGVVVRMLRYVLCFPLWGDETMLAVNYLERGYAELLQPLEYSQIAPPLFLWIELTLVRMFGFHEWSLRALPAVCSMASVPLFAHVSGRMLRGWAWVFAVAVFAAAYYPIRHGAEVKHYACDLFTALALIALVVEWRRRPDQLVWLWGLTAAAPIALGLSFTSIFILVPVALTALVEALRRKSAAVWLVGACCTAVTSASLLAVGVVAARQHQESQSIGLLDMWSHGFPPLANPLQFAWWMLDVHTGHMAAYPFGAGRGGSVFSTFCMVLGAVVLWKTRRNLWLTLIVGPLVLGFVAAALHKYPYGTTARTMLYAAPGLCLLMGLGLAKFLSWTSPERIWSKYPRPWLPFTAAAVLAFAGLGLGIHDWVKPYKVHYDFAHREFARKVWRDDQRVVLCATQDLGENLCDGPSTACDHTYRCYQAIEAVKTQPMSPEAASGKPLRCVLYYACGIKPDPAEIEAWLARMTKQRRLSERRKIDVNPNSGDVYEHYYETFDFTPLDDVARAQPSAEAR